MSEELEKLMAGWKPRANSAVGKRRASEGVLLSADLRRILAIPRRTETPDYREMLTNVFKKPRGQMYLRKVQADALVEMWHYQGLFGPLPVGSGKTLVSFLAASVLKAERPLLMVPANLLHKTEKVDFPELRRHWRLKDNQAFLSHEMLGTEKSKDILFKLMPDLLVIDEAHFFKNPNAGRTKRLLRYIDEARKEQAFPLKVVMLSGSMTRKSIKDYWHLITRTIDRSLCPLPFSYNEMDNWSRALDADPRNPLPPGALLKLCDPKHEPLSEDPQLRARSAYRRRLNETPGVVSTTDSGFGGEPEPGINIFEVIPSTPPENLVKAFYELRKKGETPGGELITDAQSIWRASTELALGFYSRWAWPSGEPDIEWLEARRNWHSVVREALKYGSRCKPPLDTTREVYNCFKHGKFKHEAFDIWQKFKDRYSNYPNNVPPTEVVWITDWMLVEAAKFIKKFKSKTVVWVSRPVFGETLAQGLGIPFFGAGDEGIIKCKQTCVASILAHGTGKNLQTFSNNIILGGLYGGARWQQLMGRTHRAGQKADTVNFFVYMHTTEFRKAFFDAKAEALYTQQTTGADQKILKATLECRTDQEIESIKNDPLWNSKLE